MLLTRPDGQIFRISPTRIQDAETCMLRFKLVHLDGLDEEDQEPSKFLTFGTAMHNVLNLAHAGPKPPSREQLFEWLDYCWVDFETRLYMAKNQVSQWEALGYESEEEEREWKDLGKSILDDYYVAQIQSNYIQAWQLEAYYQIEIPGFPYSMSVKIDRIDKLPNGKYRIIDYKTSQRAASPKDLNEDLQVLLYAWAANQVHGIPYEDIESVGLYFLRHQKFVTPEVPIDQFMVGSALHRVQDVIQRAQDGQFHPNEGWWCRFCQARNVCPAMK